MKLQDYKKCEYFLKNNNKEEFDCCTYYPSVYGGNCYYQVFQEKCHIFKLGFKTLMEDAIENNIR